MSDIQDGTYPSRALRWDEDIATVQGDDKPILKVTFDIEGTELDWTCWVADLYNDKGAPSANLKGLVALGVTQADMKTWVQGGGLVGLDRNEVNCVVDHDKNGYARVHYVNDPNDRGVRQARPMDKAQRASVAKAMHAALARLGGAAPQAPPQAPPPAAQAPAQRAGHGPLRGTPSVPPAPTDDYAPPRDDNDIPF